MKTCRDCGGILSESNWAPSRRSKKDYLCTPCGSKRQKDRKISDPNFAQSMREYHKTYSADYRKTDKRKSYEADYRKKNAEKRKTQMREWRLKKEFDLTIDEFNQLLANQNHACAICRTTVPTGAGTWHVDHCHESGVVRGLLCSKCNQMLGLASDNVNILRSAIKYLEKQNEDY